MDHGNSAASAQGMCSCTKEGVGILAMEQIEQQDNGSATCFDAQGTIRDIDLAALHMEQPGLPSLGGSDLGHRWFDVDGDHRLDCPAGHRHGEGAIAATDIDDRTIDVAQTERVQNAVWVEE